MTENSASRERLAGDLAVSAALELKDWGEATVTHQSLEGH